MLTTPLFLRTSATLVIIAAVAISSHAASTVPKEWIDADTGHRVVRLSEKPGTASFYFHQNAYSGEGDKIVVTMRDGIGTIDLQTHENRLLVDNPQFSPTDPERILYCHEGPWHMVDRLWTIKTDGSDRRKLHERTMNMEIWGHEFLSPDGKTVWYDLQRPRGEVFWLASVDLESGKRTWYAHERNEWSCHYNISPDQTLFAGDGGDEDMVAHATDGKWIYLFRPKTIPDTAGMPSPNSEDLFHPGRLVAEKLVTMRDHDYKLEPNVTFTPDGNWIVFRSNMHGEVHVYAVEIEKAGE